MNKVLFRSLAPMLMIASLPANHLTASPKSSAHIGIVQENWIQLTKGAWPGIKNGQTYWYILDIKGNLWCSKDGYDWRNEMQGVWMDGDGKMLHIHKQHLYCSTDGKSWTRVHAKAWKASDGKRYKFDKSWKVWVNS